MRIVIDLVLLLIMALCIWNGYKSGLVGGLAGILAIIIALLAGSTISSNYAYEAIPVLEPFVDGYIDSQRTRDAVMNEMGYGATDLSLEDVLASDSSLRYDYAFFWILLIAGGSLINLVFRLPDSLQLLDELGGALIGFVKGFLYCVLLCWVLSFLGLLLGRDTLENTLLARFFLTFRFLTNGLL